MKLADSFPADEPPARFDRNGLIVLRRDECMTLLSEVSFGRVAITIDALPVILPVNFRLIDESVVFRTNAGSKLDAAAVGAVVAFEVDGIDPLSHAGWSVVVTGIAAVVTDPATVAGYDRAGVPRWAPGDGTHFVALPAALVSGRVLVAGVTPPDRPVLVNLERSGAVTFGRLPADPPGEYRPGFGPGPHLH